MAANPIREDIARIKPELVKLKEISITVGVQSAEGVNIHGDSVSTDDDLLMIAGVHEYGMTIKMTDKMRRYLGAMGLFDDSEDYTPPSGNKKGYINIPERSFIRVSYDMGRNELSKVANKAIGDMIQGKIDARGVAKALGEAAVGIAVGIMGADAKPISKFTAKQRKDSSTGAPLHDTGNLLNHVTYRIEGGG